MLPNMKHENAGTKTISMCWTRGGSALLACTMTEIQTLMLQGGRASLR